MSNESKILSEADTFAALLPWYVTGKISAADRAFVDAYLKAHPEARIELAVAREEADQIFAADAALEVPHLALDKLKASIAASPAARLSAARASFLDRLGDVLAALAPRQLAYGALAAGLALAVLSGAFSAILLHQPGAPEYSTASGDKPGIAQGTFALVSLQPAAPAATLSAFLADNRFTVADGPRAGGLYRIRISNEVLSGAALDAELAKLSKRSDLFASVAPAAR